MDILIREIPISEENSQGGDLNGHVGRDSKGYEIVHWEQRFGEMSELGDTTWQFALVSHHEITNT